MSWIRSLLFLPAFLAVLVFFDIVHRVTTRISRSAFHHGMRGLNFCIIQALRLGGVRVAPLPSYRGDRTRPLIVVSNHQSMFDICCIYLIFAAHHPRFIAKIELSRGYPGISYALRNGGSALIDRKDPQSAIPTISATAREAAAECETLCIFPEGTRARDGRMKRFKPAGINVLLQQMPTAEVVPLAIRGSWRIVSKKMLPIPSGSYLETELLPSISAEKLSSMSDPAQYLEALIRDKVEGNEPAEQAA